MRLEWLGQFSFRIAPPVAVQAPAYRVQVFRYVLSLAGAYWQRVPQYDRDYPDSNHVGAYYDLLCARGKALAPGSPSVQVKLLRREPGRWGYYWVVQAECTR